MSGDHQTRSSPTWHTATFRAVQDVASGNPSPSKTSVPERRRSFARADLADAQRRPRRRARPCISKKDPCTVRCACCCLPNLPLCCQCQREDIRQNIGQTLQSQAPQPSELSPLPVPRPPSPPPSPPNYEESRPKRSSATSHQPQEQSCPCLHFLGGSPYFPAPEPNTWQFVYWPPMVPKSSRKPITVPSKEPPPRKSVSSTQQKSNDFGSRRSKSTRVLESQPKRTSSTAQRQSKRYLEEDNYYCKGGWRCQCSKYELPESCILAPLPATTAPHVETTLLVPTSTRVMTPAAAPGISGQTFRVCMPPSELPMCHCPPDCPCPHPRCTNDPKDDQSGGPCSGLYHRKSDGEDDPGMGRPWVLFGRDPLTCNNEF